MKACRVEGRCSKGDDLARKNFYFVRKGRQNPRDQPGSSDLRNCSYYEVSTSLSLDHHIKTSSHASVNFFCLQFTNSLHSRRFHFIGDAKTPLCELAVSVINTARSEQSQYHYHSDSSLPSDSATVLGALGFPAYQKYLFSSGQDAKRRSLSAQALTTSKHLR